MRPSKPWGCRSRRCPRTWTSCARSTQPGNAATSVRLSGHTLRSSSWCPTAPIPGTWKGLAEMTESWRSQVSAWEAFDAVADEVRELDDERVLVFSHLSGRGKTSGLEVGQKGAELFHIRDGKVTRLVTYWDRKRALADLG